MLAAVQNPALPGFFTEQTEMHIAGGKVARESLWLHVVLLDRGWLRGKDTQHLLAPVKGQTRAAGTASGHSQCPKDGGMGEMSQGEGGEWWLAAGSHSKMSWSKVPLESVCV